MDISFNKCGNVMASSGNIKRKIQLIIDVIDYKILNGIYLVGMLFAHLLRLHNYSNREETLHLTVFELY